MLRELGLLIMEKRRYRGILSICKKLYGGSKDNRYRLFSAVLRDRKKAMAQTETQEIPLKHNEKIIHYEGVHI